jgi:predicted lipid-binding transport protein (Tim44 family)
MPDMLPAMLAGSIRRPAVPVLVLAALVSAPGIVGCTGSDPQPATISTPPTTPAASTPTATSPAQQVEAAVRAYYAELTHAAQTGDASVLKTLTTQGCPCYRSATVIDRNARRGYQTPDASFNVVGIKVHDVEPKNAAAQVTTSEAPYDVIDKSDKKIGHVSARRSFLDLSLVQAPSGQWIIANEFDLKGSG